MRYRRIFRRAIRRTFSQAFTLIEVLVGISVLSLMLVLLFNIVRNTTAIWTRSVDTITAFQEARAAFEDISRNVSRATLNTYWTYVDSTGAENFNDPQRYDSLSNLQFVIRPASFLGTSEDFPGQAIFFLAPLGKVANKTTFNQNKTLLNAIGYYVEFGNDTDVPPFVQNPKRYRYRLMRFLEPSEQLQIYGETTPPDGSSTPKNDEAAENWYKQPITGSNPPVQPLAENILALIAIPQLPEKEDPSGLALVARANGYNYHSARELIYDLPGGSSKRIIHQLPPIVQITMIAVDEKSMSRLTKSESPPDLGINLSGLFQSPAAYENDLEDLCKTLADKGVTYRVFTSKIPIHGAKWSVQ